VVLRLRLREGVPLDLIGAEALVLRDEGLLALDAGRAVLTRRGRLLADAVIRRLV